MARPHHDRSSTVILGAVVLLLLILSWAGEVSAQDVPAVGPSFQSGFRRTEFTDARRETHALRLWYPTTAPAGKITYAGGQEGVAAQEAPVAPGAHPVVL